MPPLKHLGRAEDLQATDRVKVIAMGDTSFHVSVL
jgi:hypothetical protein